MEQNSLKQLGWLYVHIDPMRYIYIYIYLIYIYICTICILCYSIQGGFTMPTGGFCLTCPKFTMCIRLDTDMRPLQPTLVMEIDVEMQVIFLS